MVQRLANKIAIITGAGNGIGKACAKRFAEDGATVIVNDILEPNVQAVVGDITAAGGSAIGFPGDVTDAAFVQSMVNRAVDRFGRLDVMFANAGGAYPTPAHQIDLKEYHRVIALNLNSVFFGIHAALPVMMQQKSGLFLTTASGAGHAASHGLTVYGAAKAAVINMMRNIAVEYGGMGIRACAISPGPMLTEQMGHYLATMKGGAAAFGAQVPSGRLGLPEDIAVAASFLATDEAFFINGVVLPVDGGVTALLASPKPGEAL